MSQFVASKTKDGKIRKSKPIRTKCCGCFRLIDLQLLTVDDRTLLNSYTPQELLKKAQKRHQTFESCLAMPHRIAYFMREDSWFLFLFTYISLLAIYKVSLHYSIMPFDVPDSNEITIIQLGGLTGLTIVWGVSLTSCLCRLVECRICIFERIFQLVMLLILALGISRDAIFLSKTFGQSSEDLKNAQQLFNKDLNSIFFHEKSSNNFSMDFDLPFLNRIQRQFKCCGARSFKDYDKSFDGVTYKVPVSCCKSLLLCKSGTVSYEDDERLQRSTC
ncbi:MAG: Tetraspanin 15, variant 2 [Marteilia pararefringens]